MVGIEQTQAVSKPLAVANEIQPVRIAEPLARDLGLKEGQIVKGLVEADSGSLRLLLNDKPIQIPPGYPFQAGEMLAFRVVRTPGGLVLQWIERGTSNVMSAAGLPMATVRPNLPTATPAGNAIPPTILALLNRPGLCGALQALLTSNPGLLASAFAPAASRSELLQSGTIPARLRPAQIRKAIEGSGLFAEALLGKGQPPMEGDLKTTLRRLRAGGGDTSMSQAIDDALQDIESSQLQALLAQQRGELYWNLMMPMPDGSPVRMTLTRRAPRQEEPHPPFVVQIHSRNDRLGDLWLDVSLFDGPRTDLVMWAAKPQVASMAEGSVSALVEELKSAGIELGRIVVNSGARPDEAPLARPPAGSIISTEV